MYDVIVGQWLVIVGIAAPVLWLIAEAVTAPMRESEDSDWDQRDRPVDSARVEHMAAIADAEDAWHMDVWGSMERHPAGKKLPVIPAPRMEDGR